MRIIVYGAGAVGGLTGGLLARAGQDVILIGRPDNVKAINSEDEPNEVIPVVHHDCVSENGKFTVVLPALSWNVLKFSEN